MKKGGQRIKGQSFERKLCKLLGEWWQCEFKRVPLSGGWAKSKVTGDVVQVTESPFGEFPFSVEGKHKAGWNLEGLLYQLHHFPLSPFRETNLPEIATQPLPQKLTHPLQQ